MALRPAIDSAVDGAFFVLGGLSALWLAQLVFQESFTLGWGQIWFFFVFWVLLAYLVLPRLHRILTRIYVPNYFIGRARTSDGLLGDPINLALLGSESQIHTVMSAAGWTMADDVSLTSGLRIVRSTIARRSYLQAPVSPLLVFGRKQDFAYQQEVDGNPGKRHHVRFWRCPPGWMLPGGTAAEWLAAGTYDRSVGFSLFTLQVTHKIDEHTDRERDHILTSVTQVEPAVVVSTIRDFSTGYHARNGGGDAIATDGNLPVIDLREVAVTQPGLAGVRTDSRDKRPGATIVGALFVVIRAVIAAEFAITLLVSWPTIIAEAKVAQGSTIDDVEAVLWWIVAIVFVFALAELFVAWRLFLGRNWARVLAMTLSAIAIVAQAVTVQFGGPNITIQTLPGFSIDVLLLLALSSDRALTYARRPRKAPKRISGRPGDVAAF